MEKDLKRPLVSIVLPVYNCSNFISDSIGSLLVQSYENIEIIVVDDFSTDTTVDHILLFNDNRIKLFKNKSNLGISQTLNFGIKQCIGKYIARMDGDDVAHKDRILKQVNFLELNNDIAICGTGYKILNGNGVFQPKLSYSEIIMQLSLDCPFAHPTIMARNNVFIENQYAKEFEPCEDLELWTRLIPKYKVANLKDQLLFYRVHSQQISTKSSSLQLELSKNVIESYIYEISNKNKFYKFFSTSPLLCEKDYLKYKSVENSIIKYWNEKGVELGEDLLLKRMKNYLRINFWSQVNLHDIDFFKLRFFINRIGFYLTFKTLLKKVLYHS